MTIERPRPTVVRVTCHTFELAALVAAGRWVVEGCEGELPPQAVSQLRQVLSNYDSAMNGGDAS